MKDDFKIRHMLPVDVEAGMRLKAGAGWNQTEADWRRFLALNPGGCFVALHQGRVVGTATAIEYSSVVGWECPSVVGWIGMMLVDPDYRRRGIGTALMKRVMGSLHTCPSIKLDATPVGKRLYDRLGFEDEYTLLRLTGTGSAEPPVDGEVTPIADGDLPEISALDGEVFGADRMAVIRSLTQTDRRTAWKLIRAGAIRGYCAGRPGTLFHQIGPLVAETWQDAVALFQAAASHLTGQAIVVDLPAAQDAFMDWLTAAGFVKQRSFTRMYYGANARPGVPCKVFAIAGPELG